MAIQFKCPECDKPLEAPDEMVGKYGPCPQCNQRITVPRPPTSATAK